MLTTPIGRLRLMGLIEGLSYVVLLFIAMPLKYVWGDPTWVRHVGMAHGVLYIAFCFTLFDAMTSEKWTIRQALIPFIAAHIPFGALFIVKRLAEGRI